MELYADNDVLLLMIPPRIRKHHSIHTKFKKDDCLMVIIGGKAEIIPERGTGTWRQRNLTILKVLGGTVCRQ